MIWNLHFRDAFNPGDVHAAPARAWRRIAGHYVREADLSEPVHPRAHGVIVGGGGLFHLDHVERIRELLEGRPRAVLWGAGLNRHGAGTEDEYPPWVRRLRLAGVRDWGRGIRWAPCPSCMSPLFDERRISPAHEVVFLEHVTIPIDVDGGPPRLRMRGASMLEVVEFAASGAAVVTNSYHGAYWSTLLGRPVVLVEPFSSRFSFFRHPPAVATREEWRERLRGARPYPEALEECRAASEAFAADVAEVMGG